MKGLVVVAIVSIVIASGVRAPAWAQAGWYVTPSVRLSESFDNNIFGSSSDRQTDFITRITPGLEGGYRSEPFTLLASGAFESDIFAKNPQLNDATTGWQAGLNGQYLPTRALTLGLNVSYTETKSLPTLTQGLASLTLVNPLNGANIIQFGRQRVTLFSASSSAGYQFSPRTAATSAFSYTHSTFEGGATNSVYGTQFGVSHQFTALDTAMLTYLISVFESPGIATEVSNTPMIGWTRRFTPSTTLSIAAGPSFAEGSVSPAVNAQLNHLFKVFDKVATVSLGYTYAPGFVIGQAGLQNTQTAFGLIGIEPLRSLRVSLGPSFSRFESQNGTSPTITTYGVGVTASYQIYRWLSALASYTYSYQVQSIGNIPHSVLSFGLEVIYPVRTDQ